MTELGLAKLGYSTIKMVLKALWDVTFGTIVKRSHALHLAWRGRVRWETLTHGLSYCLRLSSAFSNDPNPVSTLLVRNDGDAVVDRLEVCVEVGTGNLIYQT
jgi:hypothetical protein